MANRGGVNTLFCHPRICPFFKLSGDDPRYRTRDAVPYLLLDLASVAWSIAERSDLRRKVSLEIIVLSGQFPIFMRWTCLLRRWDDLFKMQHDQDIITVCKLPLRVVFELMLFQGESGKALASNYTPRNYGDDAGRWTDQIHLAKQKMNVSFD